MKDEITLYDIYKMCAEQTSFNKDMLEQVAMNNSQVYQTKELIKKLIYVIEEKLNIKPFALIDTVEKEVKKESKKGN